MAEHTPTTIQIEKGVPIPLGGRGGQQKYPFDGMEVGDSFLVQGSKPGMISGSVQYAARTRGWTFKSRTVEGGVRIWRVS